MSTNKTPNLGLHSWVETDYVKRAEFNENFAGIDSAFTQFKVSGNVRAATTANIGLSGNQTIDGVAVTIGNRVLVKNQTTASQNGIYIVGVPAWTRAADANSSMKIESGISVYVEEGTVNAKSEWTLTNTGTIIIGSTGLTFERTGGMASSTLPGLISAGDQAKLTGIAAGAEVNQNTFTTVRVAGQADVVADAKTDVLTVAAGSGIALTTDAATDTVTIATSIPNASTSTSGLMSSADKTEFDKIKQGMMRVDLTQTLGPGTSVITTDNNGSELDVTVNGRTLVNLLGVLGGGESLSNWINSGTVTLDTAKKRSGNAGFKFISSNGGSYLTKDVSLTLDSEKSYLLGMWVYVESFTQVSGGAVSLTLRDYGASTIRYGPSTNASLTGQWQFIYQKIPKNNTLVGSGFRIMVGLVGTSNAVVYGDEIRLYEVTAAEYDAIGTTISGEAIDQYFPYVDGKQHVQGVAITKQGRNLLPGTPDSIANTTETKVNGPYDLTMTASANWRWNSFFIDVIPGEVYTLSLVGNGSSIVYESNSQNQQLNPILQNSLTSPRTFTVPSTIRRIMVVLTNASVGTFNFSKWQLELGSSATPFTPAEPQSVILPVTLGQIGDIKDSVYSSGTEWMYAERIKKNVVLDGGMAWSYNSDYTGAKSVKVVVGATLGPRTSNFRVIKYDGSQLRNEIVTQGDRAWFETDLTTFTISINDTDSGWAETINPNNNAVKALMNGWKATANNGTTYTSWTSILTGSAPATNTEAWVAANKAPGWTGWATLDYVLASSATPVVLPKAEGSITLHPGGNQVSVDTGVIQREKVIPYKSPSNFYNINSPDYPESALTRRTAKILTVCKGADADNKWTLQLQNATAMKAFVTAADFDTEATYYVTYIALDKYALTANAIETAASWHTGLSGVVSDLVQTAAELRQENDRQDFADDYIEAKIDNLKVDLTNGTLIPTTMQKYKLTEDTGFGKTVPSTDFNAILSPGEYILSGSTMTNGPITTPSGYLRVRAIDATNIIQEIVLTPTFVSWARRMNAGTWNTWTKSWNENNDGPGSGLNADTLDDLHADSVANGSTIVAREANGGINATVVKYGNGSTAVGALNYSAGVVTLEAQSANTSILIKPMGSGTITLGNESQNTLILNQSMFDYRLPTGGTGGYARGFLFKNVDGSTGYGGTGIYGQSAAGVATIENMYMAHGASPWSSGLGIYIKPNGTTGVGIVSPEERLHVHGNVLITHSTAPQLKMREQDQAVDEKNWAFLVDAKGFRVRVLNDAETAYSEPLVIQRGTGTAVTGITVGAPLTVSSLITSSTAKVNNLHVDQLDGAHADSAATASTIPIRDANKKIAEVASNRAVAKDVQLTTTSNTTIATFTPTTKAMCTVKIYLRCAAARNVTIVVNYADGDGTPVAQTRVVLPSSDMAIGSYDFIPVTLLSNANTAISVVASTTTASNVFVSAVITEEG
jgi:hypothetical protein